MSGVKSFIEEVIYLWEEQQLSVEEIAPIVDASEDIVRQVVTDYDNKVSSLYPPAERSE